MKKLTQKEKDLVNRIQSEINKMERDKNKYLQEIAKEMAGNSFNPVYSAKEQQVRDLYDSRIKELTRELHAVQDNPVIFRA